MNYQIINDDRRRFINMTPHGEFDRTFICHYLEGMTVGEGACATTHFYGDDEPEIRFWEEP